MEYVLRAPQGTITIAERDTRAIRKSVTAKRLRRYVARLAKDTEHLGGIMFHAVAAIAREKQPLDEMAAVILVHFIDALWPGHRLIAALDRITVDAGLAAEIIAAKSLIDNATTKRLFKVDLKPDTPLPEVERIDVWFQGRD